MTLCVNFYMVSYDTLLYCSLLFDSVHTNLNKIKFSFLEKSYIECFTVQVAHTKYKL